MSERKRGIICAYCDMAWGYDDESPTPELIKEACDHEAICEKNPYTAQIRNLKRERDKLREALREVLKVSEPTPVLTYQKMEDIASKALKETK